MALGFNEFQTWINEYALRLEALKDILNDLDNRIGDGDHGTNMARGFLVANQQLQSKSHADLGSACNTVAMALLSNVGGASGPLYGTVFMKLGGALKNLQSADDGKLLEGLLSAKQRNTYRYIRNPVNFTPYLTIYFAILMNNSIIHPALSQFGTHFNFDVKGLGGKIC